MSMRTLVVLRHAKSDWPDAVPDHDRPLAARGRRDAPVAGRWIAGNVGTLDHVVVSTALRTRQTWALAGPHVTLTGDVAFDERVYAASATTLMSVLREVPPDAHDVLVVGHNPGCEDLANTLAGSHDDDAWAAMTHKYPTSGVAVLRFFGAWSGLAPGLCRLEAFTVPRG